MLRSLSAAFAAAVLSAVIALSSAAIAGADRYPFCLPSENPDCFFIGTVDEDVFLVGPADIPKVIAKGKEACEWMKANGGQDDPAADWADAFSNSPQTREKAVNFALIAGYAYCDSLPGL